MSLFLSKNVSPWYVFLKTNKQTNKKKQQQNTYSFIFGISKSKINFQFDMFIYCVFIFPPPEKFFMVHTSSYGFPLAVDLFLSLYSLASFKDVCTFPAE